MTRLQLVVVGPGLIGAKHINLIKDSDQVVLNSIVAPSSNENHLIAKTHNSPLYLTLEECLQKERVDGVIISSPNEFHFEQASACIEANIPVLIEKPITVNLKEAWSLVKLVQQRQAKVLIGHHRTYSALLTTAKEELQSGRLGRLVSVVGSAQFCKPAHYFDDAPWRTVSGGGPILINLIHEIGIMRSLIGEIKAVQAVASTAVRNFSVEDTVAINLVFKNGVLGTFMLSDAAATAKSWEQTSGENPDYPAYPDEDCYFIAGTRGSLSFPSMRLKYYPYGTESSWWNSFAELKLPISHIDPMRLQLEHFIGVINGSEVPIVSAWDGYKNLQIIDSIKAAITGRCTVEIED